MENKASVSGKLEEITRVTGIRVNSHEVMAHGGESVVIDVRDEWIFRFPRQPSLQNLGKHWEFLASFAKRSPLAVPEPVFVTERFVGYRKIPGTPLYHSQIDRLRNDDKRRIAGQLGAFLATLHREHDERIGFEGGYLGKGRISRRPCPPDFEKYLSAGECRKLEARFNAIADNPVNVAEPTTIVHGDFHPGNILWDERKKVVTGVIDWSGLTLGIPAVDFNGVANFHTRRNDDFLRTMLACYGSTEDGMFHQIKACSVIEAMNWFWCYQHRGDTKGMAWGIARLKRALAADVG